MATIEGDAFHFVQYGTSFAYGHADTISTYWSVAPQYLVVLAIKAGAAPSTILQYSTIAFSMLLILSASLVALWITERKSVALLTGLLLACSPPLVTSAISGLSETPFIALLLTGLALAIHMIQFEKRCIAAALGTGVCLGVAMYYRPTEAIIDFGLICLFLLTARWLLKQGSHLWIKLGMTIGVFILISTPFFVLTKSQNTDTPSSSKLINLAYGDFGYDSKIKRGLLALDKDENPLHQELKKLKETGPLGYVWNEKGNITKRWFRNMTLSLRHLKDHQFTGAFGMGTAWFCLLLFVMGIYACKTKRWRRWLPLIALGFLMPALTCLSFAHPRWLLQAIPFFVIILADTMAGGLHQSPRSIRRLLLLVIIIFAAKNGAWAIERHDNFWKSKNAALVGEAMKSYGQDEEWIMAYGPDIAISYHTTYPLRFFDIPYGTIEEIGTFADENKVSLIAISDSRFSHYPLHDLFTGAAPPPNWELINTLAFEKNTRFGLEKENYLLYKRQPQ